MIDIYSLIAISFFFILIIGRLLEKIKIPWIFAGLIIGLILGIMNIGVVKESNFKFIADIGMYLLLFIIGLEINVKEILSQKRFMIKTTFFIILFEAFFGMLIIHYIFNYSLEVSILVALSFATVGEALLIPILDEFKAINSDIGKIIIGVGVLDDFIEILTLIWLGVLIGTGTIENIIITFLALGILFIFTAGLAKIKNKAKRFKSYSVEVAFLFSLAILFLFIGIGSVAKTEAFAALLAGIAIKTFMPEERFNIIKEDIKTITYGFFAPIFFIGVGAEVNINYILQYPLLVLLVVLVSDIAKIISSYLALHKKMGIKKSLIIGLGLSVRFSTSIVLIKILYDYGLIGADLFSVIVASSIIFKFIVPPLFSNLLARWYNARA